MSRLRAVIALSFVAACRPGVGSRCDAGEQRCIDGARALVCEAGRFIETPCRGNDGCRTVEARTSCDISGNKDGDPCSRDEEGAAACADHDFLVACRGGKFTRQRCGGPRGCEVHGGQVVCDTSVAEVGAACDKDGKKACASDGRQLLACRDGRFSPVYPCRGERGCVASAARLDCDVTLAVEGEGCDLRAEGSVACAEDRGATLICKNGRFVRDAPCKRGTRCLIDGTTTECRPPPR